MNDPRGSIWRKWDLQVHTPYSFLHHNFPEDFDEYADILLRQAVEKQVAAVGITDYFTAHGYSELKKILDDEARLTALCGDDVAEAVRRILFIPNIELRTNIIVRSPDGRNDQRVNFHVLFSNDVTPEQIEEDFLREVRFTVESAPGVIDEDRPLTIRNLENLGHRLKAQHPPFGRLLDAKVGMMNAVVNHEQVSEILERKRSIFGNRYLLVLPADEDLSECSWDGQGHLARKLMIQKSHMLFSANAGTHEFALGLRHPSVEEFAEEFKSLKPCVHCSDAHDIEKLFVPDDERYTWIKADPTFAGLKRILQEPDSRVYIGPEPPSLSRQRKNKTRYFASVSFQKNQKSTLSEHWFSGNVQINTGLVAVIGNKGSGKSALADCLGLLGNSPREEYFSFLNDNKFRRPREGKAEQYKVYLHWLSRDIVSRQLSEHVDPTAVETIKYIPQNYLENICNEIASGEGSKFDKELKGVIFSHVPEDNRLGCESFDELMKLRTDATRQHIMQLQSKLNNFNDRIVGVEERLTEDHRKGIEQQLQQKHSELNAHMSAKPDKIGQPEEDPIVGDQNAKLVTEIERLRGYVEKIDVEIEGINLRNKRTQRNKALAEVLKGKLWNLKQTFDDFMKECHECEELGIDLKDVVTFRVNFSRVEQVILASEKESRELLGRLQKDVDGTPAFERKQLLAKVEELRHAMDIPNQRYQKYIEELAEWESQRKIIEGGTHIPGSLEFLEEQVKMLDKLPATLANLKNERIDTVKRIYLEINNLSQLYATLYSPIEKAISEDPLIDQGLHIGFSVSIVPVNFEEELFQLIQKGKRGTFCGVEEGQKKLRKMLQEADFSTLEGAITFVENMERALLFDLREQAQHPVRLEELVRKGTKPIDVYNYIFGLEYLFPRYELTWGGRPLDKLSPGERGALLLVFYLLVDNKIIPLVIDQPEENLDNESIYRMLVPCIKKAKERRQVIIVTHNPNLAVVCDADQVIYCEMDKKGGNRITYTTGAIENPMINQHVVDVLEGTRPAFDMRDSKYKLVQGQSPI